MKKRERIRRMEGMIKRMASLLGRDHRELAKARGKIGTLKRLLRMALEHNGKLERERNLLYEKIEMARLCRPYQPDQPTYEPFEPWTCLPPMRDHSMTYATPATTADDIEKAYE